MKPINVALLLLAAGCGASGTTSSVDELKASLPTRKMVAIAPEVTQVGAVSTCATLGASTFGTLTHQITAGADNVLGDILGTVGNITSNPPAQSSPGHALWGPITSPTGSIYQLQVDQAGPNAIHFVLGGRTASTNFQGIMEGFTQAPDASDRAGHVAVDFDVMHALDPSVNPPAGGLQIDFAAQDPASQLTAQLPDAQYHRETDASQNTGLKYVRLVDFDGNGVADEQAQIESRWAPTGSGIAHLVITGGSLGSRVVNAVECWAPSLERTFYFDDATMHPPAGDQACCPF